MRNIDKITRKLLFPDGIKIHDEVIFFDGETSQKLITHAKDQRPFLGISTIPSKTNWRGAKKAGQSLWMSDLAWEPEE